MKALVQFTTLVATGLALGAHGQNVDIDSALAQVLANVARAPDTVQLPNYKEKEGIIDRRGGVYRSQGRMRGGFELDFSRLVGAMKKRCIDNDNCRKPTCYPCLPVCPDDCSSFGSRTGSGKPYCKNPCRPRIPCREDPSSDCGDRYCKEKNCSDISSYYSKGYYRRRESVDDKPEVENEEENQESQVVPFNFPIGAINYGYEVPSEYQDTDEENASYSSRLLALQRWGGEPSDRMVEKADKRKNSDCKKPTHKPKRQGCDFIDLVCQQDIFYPCAPGIIARTGVPTREACANFCRCHSQRPQYFSFGGSGGQYSNQCLCYRELPRGKAVVNKLNRSGTGALMLFGVGMDSCRQAFHTSTATCRTECAAKCTSMSSQYCSGGSVIYSYFPTFGGQPVAYNCLCYFKFPKAPRLVTTMGASTGPSFSCLFTFSEPCPDCECPSGNSSD